LITTQELVEEEAIKELASLVKYIINLKGVFMTGLAVEEEITIPPGTMMNTTTLTMTTSTTFLMVADLKDIFSSLTETAS
jgi:hypothetical protein